MRLNHLPSLQKSFWKLLTLPTLVEKDPSFIKPTKTLKQKDRINIYANMYFFRIRDSLKEDFPALLYFLGENRFHNLITDYLLRHPSKTYSLRYVGKHLSGFVKKHKEGIKNPFLTDLVLFEWHLLEAFDSSDDIALTLEEIKGLTPKQWGNLYLKTSSSVSLIKSPWDILSFHQNLLKKKKKLPQKTKTNILIWRKGHTPHMLKISPREFSLLRKIQKGITLKKMSFSPKELPLFIQWLNGWVNRGMLI